jgi:hypothetical protein
MIPKLEEMTMSNYQVGEKYEAKTYQESGYNFPEGKYQLLIIRKGFPAAPINDQNELDIAEEQFLEGFEGTDQYKKDLNGNWYYFEFPENKNEIKHMWIPKSVAKDVFKF